MTTAQPLTADQLNALGTATGYQGAPITSVGLPQAQAPTNAGDVKTTGSITLPDGSSPTTGSNSTVDGMVKYYQSLFDTATQQQKDIQTQKDAALQQQKTQTQPFLDKLLGAKAPSQVRADAQTTTGVDPATYFADEKAKIAEIGSLNEEYNAAKANVDQQVADLTGQGKGIPLDLLNNQAAQIQRNAAPKLNQLSANINSKAAVLQASQGMFSEAQNYVNQAVTDATADLKFNSEMYQTFYDNNQNVIDGLDTKYKDALASAKDDAEKAYSLAHADKTVVGALMINPDYAGAGITINDSLEEAQAKASKFIVNNPSLDTQIKKAQLAKLKADAVTADQSSVASWVTNIKSGTAKLSDVPASLKSAVSQGLAQAGSSVSDALSTTKSAIDRLQTMVTNNEGFSGAVGAKGLSSFFGLKGSPVAGTKAADFKNQFEQVINSTVLPNLDILRGLGRVTQKEFDTLKSAVTALSLSSSEDEFKKNLNLIQAKIDAKVTEGASGSGVSVTDPNGVVHNFPDQASADNFKKAAGIK